MQLHEIKNIHEDAFYESFMANETFVSNGELLEEGAKELFAAGKKALGNAVSKLSDAADAPAQKAWAEVQSRLATAGKDSAVQQLKDFASQHKVAIGTLAILGVGLLSATDASAGDAIANAAGAAAGAAGDAAGTGGDAILNTIVNQVQQQGMDAQKFMQAMSDVQINGVGVQDFAADLEQQAAGAANKAQGIKIQQDGIQKIIQATLRGGQDAAQTAQQAAGGAQDAAGASQEVASGGSQFTGSDGRKVNFGKGVTDTMKQAGNFMKGQK